MKYLEGTHSPSPWSGLLGGGGGGGLAGWLVGWLAGWSGWLAGWLVGWLAGLGSLVSIYVCFRFNKKANVKGENKLFRLHMCKNIENTIL